MKNFKSMRTKEPEQEKMTARAWFEILPEPYRGQAIKNASIAKLKKLCKSLDDAIYGSFNWCETPAGQGEEYWYDVYVNAQNGVYDKK